MLLSGFLKGIKLVFDGFVNLVAFVLIKAGLWLCALFTFLYIIICAIMGIKLTGGALILLIIGIVITAVLGVFFAVKRYAALKFAVPEKRKMRYLEKTDYKDEYKAKKAFETEPASEWDNSSKKPLGRPDEDKFARSNTEKRYKEPQIDDYADMYSRERERSGFIREENNYYNNQNNNSKSSYYGKPLYEQKEYGQNPKFDSYYKQDSGGQKSKYEDFNDLKKQYFSSNTQNPPYDEAAAANDSYGYNQKPDSYQNMKNEYQNPQRFDSYQSPKKFDNYQSPDTYERQENEYRHNSNVERKPQNPYDSFFNKYAEKETPMVFSTRKDPDILIHEYSDRLEFYRRNEYGGLILLSIERKN